MSITVLEFTNKHKMVESSRGARRPVYSQEKYHRHGEKKTPQATFLDKLRPGPRQRDRGVGAAFSVGNSASPGGSFISRPHLSPAAFSVVVITRLFTAR